MMNNRFAKDPKYTADNILKDLKIDLDKPIDLYNVADELNIIIRKQRIKEGILGACKAIGLKRLVVIEPEINNEGRERFTLAHEIGHIMLRHGIHTCKKEDIFYNTKVRSVEQDANLFASELLIPTQSLIEVKKDITIELIEKLAQERKVSRTAMAIKLVKLSTEPDILIYFQDNQIKWAAYSKETNFIELNNDITSDTLDNIKSAKQYKAATFFENMPEGATCWAEAKYYDKYNFYLCLIKLDDNCEK